MNKLSEHTAWAHTTVKAFAVYGITVYAVLLLVAWWHARHGHEPVAAVAHVAWAAIAAPIGFVTVQVIGSIVDRSRPYDAIANVLLLVDKTKDFSFPSDHATAAGAIATGLMLCPRAIVPRWQAASAISVAAALAFSRVYVGAHYPGDVIGGLALGAGIAAAGARRARRPLHRLITWVARTRASLLISTRR